MCVYLCQFADLADGQGTVLIAGVTLEDLHLVVTLLWSPCSHCCCCCCCLQDNEPLMRALSNLISLNQPELVLFVGEALVGNDAVDQLVKFNRSLADLAPGAAAGALQLVLLDGLDVASQAVMFGIWHSMLALCLTEELLQLQLQHALAASLHVPGR
jgi:hypothetical protein